MSRIARIYVHLWPCAYGGMIDVDRVHTARGFPGTGMTMLVGSPYPDAEAAAAGTGTRLMDGRLEVGRPSHAPAVEVPGADRLAFDGASLALCVVAEQWESITRRQGQVMAQVCHAWKWEHRIRLDRVLPSVEIETGQHHFDMEEFRWLVNHWERANRILRSLPPSPWKVGS